MIWLGQAIMWVFALIFGPVFEWFTKKAAQRLLIFAVWAGVVLLILSELDSSIRGLGGQISLVAPNLGVFYDAFLPSNFPSLITTVIAAETALTLYKWGYKLSSIKAGV